MTGGGGRDDRAHFSGYTLTELVFALAVFAVLAAVAIPNWNVLLPTYRLKGAARQIQSELHRIKAQAVSENTRYRLNFGTTNYSIERYNGASYLPTGEVKPLPDGIDIRSVTVSPIGFTARGTASPSGSTIRLCNGLDEGFNAVVSSTGRIRICRPTACNVDCN